MATIDTVTHSGEAQAAEPETEQPAESATAAMPTATSSVHPASTQQRSMTLVVTVFGAIVTALLGGMFLFMVSALDDVRDEIGSLRSEMNSEIGGLRSEMQSEIGGLRSEMQSEIGGLRSEMNARFAEMDRRFDQIHSVLIDQTDRLARIETALDIEGRPLRGKIDAPGDA